MRAGTLGNNLELRGSRRAPAPVAAPVPATLKPQWTTVRAHAAAATKIQAIFRRHLLLPRPVSMAIAAARFERTLPHTKDGELLPWLPPPLGTDFAEAEGVGTALALRFEAEIGLLLCGMFALSVFAIGHNLAGGAIERGGLRFPVAGANGSLGNATELSALRGATEGLSTLLLALAVMAMHRTYGRWAHALDERLITIADYAVELRGLPADATAARVARRLRAALPRVELVGVTLAVDEGAVLEAMGALAKAQRAARDATRALLASRTDRERMAALGLRAAASERANALDERVTALRAKQLPCVGTAFVIFNSAADAQATIRACALHDYRLDDGDDAAGFDDYATWRSGDGLPMRARRAPEPNDILWENLHVGAAERARRRRLGVAVALLAIAAASLVMGIGRFAPSVAETAVASATAAASAPSPLEAHPLFGVVCLVCGQLIIGQTLPRVAAGEGWHRASERDDSLCAKLALFQLGNTLSAGLLWLAHGGGKLSGAWYSLTAPMVSAVVFSQIASANAFGLLRVGVRVRRALLAPRARTQSEANVLWSNQDALFVPTRLSLVLKYALLPVLIGPLFPPLYALGALGCLSSFLVDSYLLLRHLPPTAATDGRLVTRTILGVLLPTALCTRVPITLAALAVRSRQLALGLLPGDACALDPVGRARGEGGGALAALRQVLESPAGCNAALLWATAGGAAALLVVGLGLAAEAQRAREAEAARAAQPPLLGTPRQRGAGEHVVGADEFETSFGLGLYVSPLQQRILRTLAAERGDDPLSRRAAFTGETVAVSLEVSLWASTWASVQ